MLEIENHIIFLDMHIDLSSLGLALVMQKFIDGEWISSFLDANVLRVLLG